jgi:hypothetical protein
MKFDDYITEKKIDLSKEEQDQLKKNIDNFLIKIEGEVDSYVDKHLKKFRSKDDRDNAHKTIEGQKFVGLLVRKNF